jgi:hypothetical protein
MLERAARADAVERDHALFAARANSGTSALRQVLRGSTVGARARLLAWVLLPSPEYMRSAFGGRGTAGLPGMYLSRVVKYVTGSPS